MNPTEIDEALRGDRRIEPSAEFRAQVMRAVHARAATGRPHVPVGRDIWSAVAVASVIIALLAAVMLLERSARSEEMIELVRWLSVTLTATVAIAWRSTRQLA